MLIKHGVCRSYNLEIVQGVHTPTDVYRIALYTSSADLGPHTTAYTPTGEVMGAGYSPGGPKLTGFSVTGNGHPARLDFQTVELPNATITARAGLIYNESKRNRAIVVVDFGKDIRSSNGPFIIRMPPVGDDTSLVRVY